MDEVTLLRKEVELASKLIEILREKVVDDCICDDFRRGGHSIDCPVMTAWRAYDDVRDEREKLVEIRIKTLLLTQ